MLTEP